MKINMKNGQTIECTPQEYIEVRKLLTEKTEVRKTEVTPVPKKERIKRKKWNEWTKTDDTFLKEHMSDTPKKIHRTLKTHSIQSIYSRKYVLRKQMNKTAKVYHANPKQDFTKNKEMLSYVQKVAHKMQKEHPSSTWKECMQYGHRAWKVRK